MPGSSISSTQAPPGAPQVPEGAAGSSGWRGLGRRLKAAVRQLKQDVLALHYALQDPRVGWLPRILGFLAIAYALSPLDLIPDFIPVGGRVGLGGGGGDVATHWQHLSSSPACLLLLQSL